jgi:hypothetical protein
MMTFFIDYYNMSNKSHIIKVGHSYLARQFILSARTKEVGWFESTKRTVVEIDYYQPYLETHGYAVGYKYIHWVVAWTTADYETCIKTIQVETHDNEQAQRVAEVLNNIAKDNKEILEIC